MKVVFVDVDDTLVRSVGTKRIPIPAVIAWVRRQAATGAAVPFDMGPPLAEILKNCKAETGLEPPQPPVFKKIAKMPIYKSKPSMSKLVLKKRVA